MPIFPPRDAMAQVVASFVEAHTEWDSLHQFVTLNWDGVKIAPGTVAAIHQSIHPGGYPQLMGDIAAQEISDQQGSGKRSLYGFLLQWEGYAVPKPDPSTTAEERERLERDRRGRALHQRSDAVEVCTIYCVDIHGRLWTAAKRRPTPDDIVQHFYADPADAPGGTFVSALRAVASLTGAALHGLPVPTGGGL